MGIKHDFSLDAKYRQLEGQIFLSGIQALVRLPLDQHRADQRRGLNTATMISGYRGSPLGRPRSGPGAQRGAAERAPRPLHLRRQRGPRRDHRVRQPARQHLPAAEVRRRPRHVVRQGPRRGPQRRRLQARQLLRGGTARRRAGRGGRRSLVQVVDPAHPLRGGLLRRLLPRALPGQRAGDPRSRPARLRAVALLRPVGGHEDRHQRGRRDRHGHRRPRSRRHRDPGLHVRGPTLAARAESDVAAPVRPRHGAGHPLRAPGGGQGLRGGQRAQRHHRPHAGRVARHRRPRQDLLRPARGAPRAGAGRRRPGAPRHPPAAHRHALPDGARHRAGVRAGPGGDPRRRGEARLRGALHPRRPLQPRRASPRRRQARPRGPPAGAGQRRAGRRPHRPDHRLPDREARPAQLHHRAGGPAGGACASARRRSPSPARRTSARAARTTGRRWCPRARWPAPASAVTAWSCP